MSKPTGLILFAALLVMAACGGGDDKSSGSTDSGATTTVAQAKKAPLHGGIFRANDVADCLIDAGVGGAVSLDGADIQLNDATAEVIVKQGAGKILVYSSAGQASGHEADYRRSSGSSSEVKLVRNLLVEADSDLASADKAKVDACLGV